MGEGITIPTGIDTSGFKKGAAKLTNAIKSLGKSSTRNAVQIGKSVESMGKQAVKTVGSLFGIVSVLGVIRKATNTYLQQNKELSGKLNSIWTSLGNVLGPVIEQLVGWITKAVSYLLEFLRLLGVTTKKASQLSKSANGAAGSLQKSLLGFDELNKLSDGGGGNENPLDDVEMPEWATNLINLLKKSQWDDAATILANEVNHLFDKIDWRDIGTRFGKNFNGIMEFIGKSIERIRWTTLGHKLAEGFNSITKEIDGANIGRVIVAKLTIITGVIGGFLEELRWDEIFRILSQTLTQAIESISTAIDKIDFKAISNQLKRGIDSIDITEMGTSILHLLNSALGAIKDIDILGIINAIVGALARAVASVPWHDVGTSISYYLSHLDLSDKLSDIVENIKKFLVEAFNGAIDLVGGLLGWDNLETEKLKTAFEDIASYLQPIYDIFSGSFTEIWDGFIGTLSNAGTAEAFGLALKLVKDSLEVIYPIVEKLVPLMTPLISNLALAVETLSVDIIKTLDSIMVVLKNFIKFATGELSFSEMTKSIRSELSDLSDGVDETLNDLTGGMHDIQAVFEESTQLSLGIGDASGLLDKLTNSYLQYSQYCAEAGKEAIEFAEIVKLQGGAIREGADAQGEYIDVIGREGTYIGRIYKNTEEYVQMLEASTRAIAEASESTEILNEVADNTADAVEQATIAQEQQADATEEASKTTLETARDFNTVATALSQYLQVTDEQKQGMEDLTKVITTASEAVAGFVEANKTAKSSVEEAVNVMVDAFSSLSDIAQMAYTWGQDVAIGLYNGMMASSSFVVSGAQSLAGIINSYLHFSEPDVGPLADFHTYMPDMIDSMVEGIEGNGGKVENAIADLSSQMADEVQSTELDFGNVNFEASMDSFADKIVDGFENLIERLSAIAENVNFAVPSFAGGMIPPYSVNDSASSSQSVTDALVRTLQQFADNFNGGGNSQPTSNLWNIALSIDGQELATKIEKIQRQDERAWRTY